MVDIDLKLQHVRSSIQQNTSSNLSVEQMATMLKDYDGMTKLYYALSNDYMPDDLDGIRDVVPDIMHILFAGITRKEPARMIRLLFKSGAGYVKHEKPWEELNTRIAQLRLPKGKRISRIPPLKPDISFDELKLDLSSSEIMHFALHSVTLIEPMLTAKGLQHPAWKSWLKHREIVQIVVQHTFDVEMDSARLTEAIEEHSRLHQQVRLLHPRPAPCR